MFTSMKSNYQYRVVGFYEDGTRGPYRVVKNPDDTKKLEKIMAEVLAEENVKHAMLVDFDDYMKLLGNVDGKVYIYSDGAIVEKPKSEPTDEEKKASQLAELKSDYEAGQKELSDSLMTAQLRGDTDAVASIQSEFKEMQEAYEEAVKEVG